MPMSETNKKWVKFETETDYNNFNKNIHFHVVINVLLKFK